MSTTTTTTTSVVVNVAEDAEVRMVRWLAQHNTSLSSGGASEQFVAQCEQCIQQSNAEGLCQTILAQPGTIATLVQYTPSEQDPDEEESDPALAVFSLLAALLDRLDAKVASPLVTQLAQAIAQTPGEGKQLELLAILYNMRSNHAEDQMTLLQTMIPFLNATSNSTSTEVLAQRIQAASLKQQLTAWKATPAQQRALYQAALNASSTSDNNKNHHELQLALLATFGTQDAATEEALACSKACAIQAIRDPVSLFAEQRNLLTLPAIQALKSSSDAALYELLVIFQTGTLSDYQTSVASKQSVLQAHGLDADECLKHMRILSLCSLASNTTTTTTSSTDSNEIPYATVADALQIELSEVEPWVILAVRSGLLQAKLDQLQSTILVERSVVRQFELPEWKALQRRLVAWKSQAQGVLQALEQAKATAVPATGN